MLENTKAPLGSGSPLQSDRKFGGSTVRGKQATPSVTVLRQIGSHSDTEAENYKTGDR